MIEEYHNSPLLPPYVEDSRHNGPIWSRPQLKQRQTYCNSSGVSEGLNLEWVASHIRARVDAASEDGYVVGVKLKPKVYAALMAGGYENDSRLDWRNIRPEYVGAHRIMKIYKTKI